MVIFPLAPDQTIAQMWSNGVQGGRNLPAVNKQSTATMPTWWWFLASW